MAGRYQFVIMLKFESSLLAEFECALLELTRVTRFQAREPDVILRF